MSDSWTLWGPTRCLPFLMVFTYEIHTQHPPSSKWKLQEDLKERGTVTVRCCTSHWATGGSYRRCLSSLSTMHTNKLNLYFCMKTSLVGHVVHMDMELSMEINSSFWTNFHVVKPVSPFHVSLWPVHITLNQVLFPSEDNKIIFPHNVKQTTKWYTLTKSK